MLNRVAQDAPAAPAPTTVGQEAAASGALQQDAPAPESPTSPSPEDLARSHAAEVDTLECQLVEAEARHVTECQFYEAEIATLKAENHSLKSQLRNRG